MHKSIIAILVTRGAVWLRRRPELPPPRESRGEAVPDGAVKRKPLTRESPASGDIYSHAPTQAEFWKQFNDPVLNSMVSDALTANYDLRIALGRLVQARALRNESLFDLAPTVTASGGYTKQRTPAVENPFGGPYTTKLYDAGFDATWELDFFGGVRRGIQARNAELEGEVANLHDAQVSVDRRSRPQLLRAARRADAARRRARQRQEPTAGTGTGAGGAPGGQRHRSRRGARAVAAQHHAVHDRPARGGGLTLHSPPERADRPRSGCADRRPERLT